MMKLSAQLYSVRDYIRTPEDLLKTMKKLAALGYETVQLAGAPINDAILLRDLSQEASVRQVCPCFSMDAMVCDVESVIDKLKILRCDAIMLPYMEVKKAMTEAEIKAMWAPLDIPLRKLQDAGISPAYHNHAFEFRPIPNRAGTYFDYLLDKYPDWQFILDVCWAEYTGVDPTVCMERIGSHRLKYVHFKDMTAEKDESGKPVFCPCGQGTVDLVSCARKAKALGTEQAIVEQDNAAAYPDAFEQMRLSAEFMKPLL